MTDIKQLLIKPEFPLSGKYDPDRIMCSTWDICYGFCVRRRGVNLYDPAIAASNGMDR